MGTGLTVGDAPTCKPFGPTGAPGTVPSEEVTPSEGVTVPTWANAGLAYSKDQAVAATKATNKGLMEHFSDKSGRINQRASAGAAVSTAAEARAFLFMSADRG